MSVGLFGVAFFAMIGEVTESERVWAWACSVLSSAFMEILGNERRRPDVRVRSSLRRC